MRTPAIAFVVCLGATLLLRQVARGSRWTDDGREAPERKRQREPVPLIGGTAIAMAVAAVVVDERWIVPGDSGPVEVLPGFGFEHAQLLGALFLAFATGLVDDLLPRGLGPLAKLGGQMLAGIVLAHGLRHDGASAGAVARGLCAFGAVVAQNAANTFDNADGALCAVAFLGLALAGSSWGSAGAVLAFLPFNLWLRRSGSATPFAYLGDSGSHLLGLLLFVTPGAWGALVLPILDLARVASARARDGQPIWKGDRRHLAHRLQDAGRGPTTVVAMLVVCALPAIAGAWASVFLPLETGRVAWASGGCLATAALLITTLALHPERHPVQV